MHKVANKTENFLCGAVAIVVISARVAVAAQTTSKEWAKSKSLCNCEVALECRNSVLLPEVYRIELEL